MKEATVEASKATKGVTETCDEEIDTETYQEIGPKKVMLGKGSGRGLGKSWRNVPDKRSQENKDDCSNKESCVFGAATCKPDTERFSARSGKTWKNHIEPVLLLVELGRKAIKLQGLRVRTSTQTFQKF